MTDTTKPPERIWLDHAGVGTTGACGLASVTRHFDTDVEYVRADLGVSREQVEGLARHGTIADAGAWHDIIWADELLALLQDGPPNQPTCMHPERCDGSTCREEIACND